MWDENKSCTSECSVDTCGEYENGGGKIRVDHFLAMRVLDVRNWGGLIDRIRSTYFARSCFFRRHYSGDDYKDCTFGSTRIGINRPYSTTVAIADVAALQKIVVW